MANRESAGILLYRIKDNHLQFFLVHPGGPFWNNKDAGVWSIPKGEFTDEELPLDAAKREFKEETNSDLTGDFIELTPIKQKAGKLVYAFAVEGDIDEGAIVCNTFKMQWPPKSGNWQSFPEVDKSAWFSYEEATKKINAAQIAFLDELILKLKNVK